MDFIWRIEVKLVRILFSLCRINQLPCETINANSLHFDKYLGVQTGTIESIIIIAHTFQTYLKGIGKLRQI